MSKMKIGLIIKTDEYYAEGGPVPSYATMRGLVLQAEQAGFDSIWLADHLLYLPDTTTPWMTRPQGAWECWTMLSALAEASTRINIGTLVINSQTRNPAVLAKMAVTLEEVSGGRLILGLGTGWHGPEFQAFNLPWDHRVSRYEEALQIIVPLLRTGKVNFEGEYHRAIDCEMMPRGPRAGGPPILIGARGPQMLRLAARYADIWHPGSYPDVPRTRSEVRIGLDAACAEVGRDPATLEVAVSLRSAYPEAGPLSDRWNAGATAPDEIAQQLRAYEELGVDHVFCEVLPGSTDSVTRLSEQVQVYRQG
jgi:probable F420-dependent oxidoreductase